MTDAVEYDEEGKMSGGGIRTVRLRRVNRNLVIPEQVYFSNLQNKNYSVVRNAGIISHKKQNTISYPRNK